MWRTNRNFIISYIFLVALPVLGVTAILQFGRHVSAPAAVAGTWSLNAKDTSDMAQMLCSRPDSRDATMIISQSSSRLMVRLDGWEAIAGVIEGSAMRAFFRSSKGLTDRSGCASERTLALTADVQRKLGPKTIVGTLSVVNCPRCPPVEFQAVSLVRMEEK